MLGAIVLVRTYVRLVVVGCGANSGLGLIQYGGQCMGVDGRLVQPRSFPDGEEQGHRFSRPQRTGILPAGKVEKFRSMGQSQGLLSVARRN